ncbi:hypothetical protein EDE09_11659 [Neorhizobium sp. S3-V5DH]|nr:hypothetical protein EDE09_11659 [Neorhizobium sp. S3-V5DH]
MKKTAGSALPGSCPPSPVRLGQPLFHFAGHNRRLALLLVAIRHRHQPRFKVSDPSLKLSSCDLRMMLSG